MRKALRREHVHHPELAICSQCRSADTSNTMKTLGRMSTDSPFSQGLHVIISDWIASLIVPRLGPNKRVEPARSSEQLPRPNTRRCCADLDRYGLRMAIVLSCCVPYPVASREMTIGSSAAPPAKNESGGISPWPGSWCSSWLSIISNDLNASRPFSMDCTPHLASMRRTRSSSLFRGGAILGT